MNLSPMLYLFKCLASRTFLNDTKDVNRSNLEDLVFIFDYCFTILNVSHPSNSPGWGAERSSMTSRILPDGNPSCPLHAQEETLSLIIMVCDPESVLPDVLAMHTIEMIPKSMILMNLIISIAIYDALSHR